MTISLRLTIQVNPLGLTALLTTLAAILCSSLVWFAERGEWDAESRQWLRDDGSPSPFVDIPTTMWWCIVTFTTVGYGDMSPVTPWGQASGVLAMFAGLLVIALPSSVIGTNFEATFAERTLSERLEQQVLMPPLPRTPVTRRVVLPLHEGGSAPP